MKKIFSLFFVIVVAMAVGVFFTPAAAMADPVTLIEANEFLVKEFSLNPLTFSEKGWKADLRENKFLRFSLTTSEKQGEVVVGVVSTEVVRIHKPGDMSLSQLSNRLISAVEKSYEKYQGKAERATVEEREEIISASGKSFSGSRQKTEISFWAERWSLDMYLVKLDRGGIVLEVGKFSGKFPDATDRCREILGQLLGEPKKIVPGPVAAAQPLVAVTPVSASISAVPSNK